MRKKVYVPIYESKEQQKNHINESYSGDIMITTDELKSGINLLALIRDGYSKYKDFYTTLTLTKDEKINVFIYSEKRDVYSEITISGRGIDDCEAAPDYAIDNIIIELKKKDGEIVNESLKDKILSGALGLAMIGFAYGTMKDLKDDDPIKYENHVLTPEEEKRREEKIIECQKQKEFYDSVDWSGMNPDFEGYVYDKIPSKDGKGGTLVIMCDMSEKHGGYPRGVIRYLGVNEKQFGQYQKMMYINVEDVLNH